MKVYSTAQAAERLGLSPRRVRALAKSRKVGTLVHDRALVFTEADIRKMEDRPGPGRPSKTSRKATGTV